MHALQRTVWGRLVRVLLASALLGACATPAGHPGHPGQADLRLDTESAARLRHAGVLGAPSASTASLSVASSLVRFAPALLVLLRTDAAVNELEQRLLECVQQAEHQVNPSLFGDRAPTREECGEEVSVDGCDEPITRAMLLGQQKHAFALACARDVLNLLWPAPFSIEQRYRFYPNSRIIETISREAEKRFIAEGCTDKLRGTIKPDIILHPEGELLQAVLVLDLKFPCPASNRPTWKKYGSGSPHEGLNQGQVYKMALGGDVLLLSPRGFTK